MELRKNKFVLRRSNKFTMILKCIILSIIFDVALSESDSFHEELLLKPLDNGKVYSYFQFTTLWNKSLETNQYGHCHLFPHALMEIIQTYEVQELHISLTEGQWKHRYWGYAIVEAPPGAELWVWFKPNTRNIDEKWKGLTAALSGLLCASFNFIDSVNSVSPRLSFRPKGIESEMPLNSERLRYATLPREIVCTENLTPWKKLLPCDSNKGLSTLLNARYIHNTNYHSVGVHYRQICANDGCSKTKIELQQTVSLVYDLVILTSSIKEWSIRKLFGIGLFGSCPVAQDSNIYVDISDNNFELVQPPDNILTNVRGGQITKYAVYDFKNINNLSVKNIRNNYQSKSPILHANRYIRDYGKEVGGIVTKIYNNHREPIDIIYFENIPWFVPVYYHTLKIVNGNNVIKPKQTHYIPGKIRTRPYYLEVAFTLPPRSVTEISIDFDYMFLKWQEYPPDANHGFYVGSAVITASLPYARNYYSLPRTVSLIKNCFNVTDSDGYIVQLRTESFILSLPTPDFSMPYNVICLSCTVVALAFGPIHNITTKRLRLSKKVNKSKLKMLLDLKFFSFLRLRSKTSEQQEESNR